MLSPSKACNLCGEDKPLEEFGRDARLKSGYAARCKACKATRAKQWRVENPNYASEYMRAYREANAEVVAAGKRRWYEANRERVADRDKLYREANRERIAERQREWFEANRERKRASHAAWRAANPEKWADYRDRRRAQERLSATGVIDFKALWTGSCGICDEPMDWERKRPDPMSKSIDHIVPLSKGGSHTQDNVQWAHLVCNMRKGDRQEGAA